MSDDLLDGILERVDQAQRSSMRLGTVASVDGVDASLVVDVAGGSVEGVRFLDSYSTPTVGDMVVLSRVGASWVVLGKLSKQLTAVDSAEGTVTILPSGTYGGEFLRGSGGPWQWQTASLNQGVESYQFGPSQYENAGILLLESTVPAALPEGATLLALRVSLRRAPGLDPSGNYDSNTAALVAPLLYGHDMTAAPITGEDPADLFVSGFGPLELPGVERGATLQYDLPSTWVTAFMDGTLRGFGLWDGEGPHGWFFGSMVARYSLPA